MTSGKHTPLLLWLFHSLLFFPVWYLCLFPVRSGLAQIGGHASCSRRVRPSVPSRVSFLPHHFLRSILIACHVFNCRNTSFPSLWAAKRTRSICRGSRAASSTWVARWHRQVKINIFITFFSSLTFSFIYLSPKSAHILQMTVLSFRFNLKLLVYCQLSLN